MTETPKFSYDEVYSDEHRISVERKESEPKVSAQEINETLIFVQDESESFFENLPENTDWSQVHKPMIEKFKSQISDYKNQVEQSIITSSWLMGAMINQSKKYAELNDRYLVLEDLTETEGIDIDREDEKESIRNQIDKMNTLSANYQIEVSKMIFALRNTLEGKKHLRYFWKTFNQLASLCLGENQTFSDGYRRGIEGAVATHDIFQSLGFETYFPDPTQDAIEGIDGWAKKGDKTVALQIKTHRKGSIRVKTERLRDKKTYENLSHEEAKQVKQRNKFLDNTNKYTKTWGIQVMAIWVDLEGYGGLTFQQDEAGNIIIPPDINTSQLASGLEEQLNG